MGSPFLGRNAPAAVPTCFNCHRFVDMKTVVQHPELGDYGTVHSVEFECARCAGERVIAERAAAAPTNETEENTDA